MKNYKERDAEFGAFWPSPFPKPAEKDKAVRSATQEKNAPKCENIELLMGSGICLLRAQELPDLCRISLTRLLEKQQIKLLSEAIAMRAGSIKQKASCLFFKALTFLKHT